MFVDHTVWMYKVFCHIQLSHRCGLWSKNQATGCRNWWGCLWDRCVPFPGGLSQSIFVSSTLFSLYRISPILHEVMRLSIHDTQHLQCLRANQIGVSYELWLVDSMCDLFPLQAALDGADKDCDVWNGRELLVWEPSHSPLNGSVQNLFICSSHPKKILWDSEVLSKFLQLEAGSSFQSPKDSFLNRKPWGVAQRRPPESVQPSFMEPVMLAICQTFAESPACQTIQNNSFLRTSCVDSCVTHLTVLPVWLFGKICSLLAWQRSNESVLLWPVVLCLGV